MSRFAREKRGFFDNDTAARYLSERIAQPYEHAAEHRRGSFGWVLGELSLDDVSAFVLALALTSAMDGSIGSVIATCMNDASRTAPSLALAQRLWDSPNDLLALADPFHPLFRSGIVRPSHEGTARNGAVDWDGSLTIPPIVARALLYHDSPLPHGLRRMAFNGVNRDTAGESARVVATRLTAAKAGALRIVPVIGPRWSDHRGVVGAIARIVDADVIEHESAAHAAQEPGYLDALATYCWLRGHHLYLAKSEEPAAGEAAHRIAIPHASIPATLYLAVGDRRDLAGLPERLLTPIVEVPAFTYHDRAAHWRRSLGTRADGLERAIAECSRRYRYEREMIDRICDGLRRIPGQLTDEHMLEGCRAELDLDLGELAARVRPRFSRQELVLPYKQRMQFDEHVKAMRALTEVHYSWGTAQAWGESGISVLFAGPPGTGKTMGAEVLASELGLPMYRVDLSQVVNKYIGETEKNLKRVFDAADAADMILFFDEADSLFGKRTDVSDSKDRYANLEVSYLLERMERFKGLAILATNRKKDLDDAFLRRLRYVIDFPLPDAAERRRIWQQVIPPNVDASALDFAFLGDRFAIAGGNIRSIVFNACLQSADGSTLGAPLEAPEAGSGAVRGRLTMEQVVIALRREYDKMGRAISLEQFGPYVPIVRRLDDE
ncbi:MAG: ATP-binding protein [Bacteroidetes bacterium]|nr:ATP-binding protein [Bacteroidota bacterium]